MAIKELSETFEGKGEVKDYNLRQHTKNDYGYIYELTNKDDNTISHYEVFARKEVKQFDFETKTELLDTKISYPKSDHFGVWAWCVRSLESAQNQLIEIEKHTKLLEEKKNEH